MSTSANSTARIPRESLRIAPDHEDRAFEILLAQGDGCLCPAVARSDDDDVRGHLRGAYHARSAVSPTVTRTRRPVR